MYEAHDPTEVDKRFVTGLFREFLGRQPERAELEKLIFLKQKMRLSNDDPLWNIILCLENYDVLMGRHVENITNMVDEIRVLNRSIHLSALEARRHYSLVPKFLHQKIKPELIPLISTRSLFNLLVILSICLGVWSFVRTSSFLEVAQLNGGTGFLASCFNGMGYVETRKNGEAVCYAINKGRPIGIVIRGAQSND